MKDFINIELPSGVKYLTRDLVVDYANYKDITLPNGVIQINRQAFSCFAKLENIILPSTCIEINDEAFNNCCSLKSITLPSGVTSIKYGTFSGCSDLKEVNLPDSLKEIRSYAFNSCSSLEKIVVPKNVKYINESAFMNCYSLRDLNLPFSLKIIGENTFSNCQSLSEVNVPDNVTLIRDGAFSNCFSLKSIHLSKKLRKLEYGAFAYCEKLDDLIIPKGVKNIDASTFYECKSLQNIKLHNGVENIGASAFYGCTTLSEIILPKKLQNIHERAFSECVSLKNIFIPKGVSRIESQTFENCLSLKGVSLHNRIKSIGIEAFSGCQSLVDIDIPNSVIEIGESAFMDCTSLSKVKIPKYVDIIQPYTFAGCTSLKEVEIPEGVYSICSDAFNNCKSLKKLVMPESLIGIGINAFQGCLFNYVYKDKNKIVFSCELPKDLNRVDKLIDLNEIKKVVMNFDVSLFATENGLNNYLKAIDVLKKSNVKLSANILRQLNSVDKLEQIGKDLNLKYFKNESKLICEKISNYSLEDEINCFKFAGLLGCFSHVKLNDKFGQVTDFDKAQKSNTFFSNVVKNNLIKPSQFTQIFNDLPMDFGVEAGQQFLNFITLRDENKSYRNLDMLLGLENLYPGIFAKVMMNFDDIKGYRVTLDNNGKPHTISWSDAFIKYYQSNAYANVNDENREIAKVFSDKGLEQYVFDKASTLYKDAKELGVKSHILGKPLKEKSIFEEIEDIKNNTGEILSNGKELIEDLYSKHFTYEMLDKYDPRNSIIGLYCSCCATIIDSNYGKHIAVASVKSNDVQNLVINDFKGDIVAKGAMYINSNKGYIVINDFEINQKYRQSETYKAGIYANNDDKTAKERDLIFKAFIRGVKDFIREYDLQHPNKPINQVNVGIGYNRLKSQCYKFKIATKNLEVPCEYNFLDAYSEQRILYQRNTKINQQEGMDL